MGFGKKATLIGFALAAAYSAAAIAAYLIYSSVAYSAYKAEQDRLEKVYQAQLAAVPANQEKRRKMEAEFESEWETTKAEIEAKKDEALAPARQEYWRRMEAAKRKRDSADPLTRIHGSTEEMRAESAWRTDAQPIATQYSEAEQQEREALNSRKMAAIEAFEKHHPSDVLLISRDYPPESLLPSMTRSDFQQALKLGGFGLLALYVAFACLQAVRLSSRSNEMR